MMRTVRAGGVATSRGTFLKYQEIGMQIVSERDREKQKYQGAGHRGPLAPGGVLAFAKLNGPADTPHAQQGESDGDPQ
jgi:hypothetical protein